MSERPKELASKASVAQVTEGVLTRPLGASIGDYLSQPTGDGGLGFGTVVTSGLFLAVILGLVVYLAVSRKDVAEPARVTQQAD